MKCFRLKENIKACHYIACKTQCMLPAFEAGSLGGFKRASKREPSAPKVEARITKRGRK